MPSPSGQDPHGFVSVTEPAPPHPGTSRHIPGRSHQKPVFHCGRACHPGQGFEGATDEAAFVSFVKEVLASVLRPGDIVLPDRLSRSRPPCASTASRIVAARSTRSQSLPPDRHSSSGACPCPGAVPRRIPVPARLLWPAAASLPVGNLHD